MGNVKCITTAYDMHGRTCEVLKEYKMQHGNSFLSFVCKLQLFYHYKELFKVLQDSSSSRTTPFLLFYLIQ